MTARDRTIGLGLACLWAGGALPAVLATDSIALRSLVCLPLAFYWPGHAFLHAIGQPRSSAVEWHALAVLWSMASLVPGGFLLNALGLLGPVGWAGWLAAVVLLCVAAAVLRPPLPEVPDRPARAPLRLAAGPAAVFLLALTVAGAALALAIHDRESIREFRYTEFWMVPDQEERPGAVTIGLRNAEGRPMQYDVELMIDGGIIATWREVELQPDETVTREVAIGPRTGRVGRIEARLFDSDHPGRIYRKLWLQPGGPG